VAKPLGKAEILLMYSRYSVSEAKSGRISSESAYFEGRMIDVDDDAPPLVLDVRAKELAVAAWKADAVVATVKSK
jgi:hypothetical protein